MKADELAREKEKVVKASEERNSLLLERELLEKEVADLKATMVPAEDKLKGVANLKTCVELVARIQVLESNSMDALADGFETVMVQLSVLNLRLNTEGTWVLSQVINGRVVPPPDSPEVEVGTPRSD